TLRTVTARLPPRRCVCSPQASHLSCSMRPSPPPRILHSFPTRRSSDLPSARRNRYLLCGPGDIHIPVFLQTDPPRINLALVDPQINHLAEVQLYVEQEPIVRVLP